MEVFYNLPKKVIFCKKCVLSNQRPSSVPEFQHKKDRKGAKYLNIDLNTGIPNRRILFERAAINSLIVPKLFTVDYLNNELLLYSNSGRRERIGILKIKD